MIKPAKSLLLAIFLTLACQLWAQQTSPSGSSAQPQKQNPPQRPSEPSTTLKVDVNLVNVTFTSRDTQGTLAAGLTQDDFEVFEDGIPQKISFFARSANVPLTLGLILDASGSQEHFVKAHRSHLETFLHEVLGPQDHAFLVCFGNHLRLVSDLSPSIALL